MSTSEPEGGRAAHPAPCPCKPLPEFAALPREQQVARVHHEFSQLAKIDAALCADAALFETALSPKHKMKNRYMDVLANETTLYPPRHAGVYINGNLIAKDVIGVDRDFIACQAPLPEYLEEFWTAMVDSGASLIVNLTGIKEAGRVKSDPYWPAKVGEKLAFGRFSVTLMEARTPEETGIEHTAFRIVRHDASGKHFTIAHYTGWPDMGVPETTTGVSALVRLIESKPAGEPVVVHCSAGIGRTGTLIAAYAARHLKRRNLLTDGSIRSVVSSLKQSRTGMVQRREQLGLVYLFALADHCDGHVTPDAGRPAGGESACDGASRP